MLVITEARGKLSDSPFKTIGQFNDFPIKIVGGVTQITIETEIKTRSTTLRFVALQSFRSCSRGKICSHKKAKHPEAVQMILPKISLSF